MKACKAPKSLPVEGGGREWNERTEGVKQKGRIASPHPFFILHFLFFIISRYSAAAFFQEKSFAMPRLTRPFHRGLF